MIEMDNVVLAKANLAELKALFAGKHFKSVDLNLESLERKVAEHTKLAFERKTEDETISFYFKGNALPLKPDSPVHVLFEKLLNEKYLSRASIISILYDRDYDPEKDPKLVYYHIHNLRKKLQQIGAPDETILTEEDGYQLSPQVTLIDVEN